jgi:Na+/melibiose symporter-like transporter
MGRLPFFVHKADILINRNFAWLWTGQAISLLGDWVFETALVLWIATVIARSQPWAPLAVSAVLVATSAPILLIRPFAGVFVDRWDKRRAMLYTDAVRAALLALLILTTGSVPLPFLAGRRLPLAGQLSMIYSVVFLVGLCTQFFRPARLALIGDIVASLYRGRAFGMNSVTENPALVIGPPLATLIFASAGVQWTLLLDACSFAVSFLCVLRISVPQAPRHIVPGEQRGALREFGAGLRFFVGNRTLMALTVTLGIVMLGAGALNTLNVFFVTQNLHAPASLYGLALTAVGIGSIAGAALAALVVDRLGAARAYWIALVLLGLLVILYSRLTSLVPALVVLLLAGLPQAALTVVEGPLLLHATPQAMYRSGV